MAFLRPVLAAFLITLGSVVSAQDLSSNLRAMGLSPLPQRPQAPAWALAEATTGAIVKLENFRGRYVLLNFWATWCAPCREEMPSLENLTRLLPPGDLVVLAIASGEARPVVSDFLKASPHSFTVVVDPTREASNRFGVKALPTTYLIDPQGRVLAGKSGAAYWDAPAFVEGIRGLVR